MAQGQHGDLSWRRLSQRTLSVAALRSVDRIAVEQFAMNSLVLMENAAGACARWLSEHYGGAPKRAVLLCGRGNNGGDGLAIARHLKACGWRCHVVLLGPPEKLSVDTLANWRILTARKATDCLLVDPPATADTANQSASVSAEQDRVSSTIRHEVQSAHVVIDAMLGSGASGAPRAPFDRWIQWANAAPGERIAIDIPTGLDAESGRVASSVFQAAATLTFVARKPGFDASEARHCLGQIEVMPIGIPIELIEQLIDQSVSSGPGGGS